MKKALLLGYFLSAEYVGVARNPRRPLGLALIERTNKHHFVIL